MQFSESPIIVSEDTESSVMGMDSSGMDQACFFLRDKIYSDKIGAVVREYITNALDEHVKHSISDAVVVRLAGNEFSVRDFAKGLCEDDVRNVFGMYFKSTKRSNNLQSGMFGLGSKSAHCYTDTFMVHSYYEGVETIYACSLGGGNQGVSVGHILKISEEPTSETGLKIAVEVKNTDIARFHEKILSMAQRCSKNIVFETDVNTSTYGERIVPDVPIRSFERDGFVFKLYAQPKRPSNDRNVYELWMGDVLYSRRLFPYLNNKRMNSANEEVLVVDIPIGRMSLPISRESFEDTPSNTKVLDEIDKIILEKISEEFSTISEKSTLEVFWQDRDNKDVRGDYFIFPKSSINSKLYSFIEDVRSFSVSGFDSMTHEGKLVLCIIPPSKRRGDQWFSKLNGQCHVLQKSFYGIRENHYNEALDDSAVREQIEKFFYCKKAKSVFFKWEKETRDFSIEGFEANIYIGEGWRQQTYYESAFEFHQNRCRDMNLPVPATVDEAKDNMSKIDWKTVDKCLFQSFSVVHALQRTYESNMVWTKSKQMLKNLVELGWFDRDSNEYDIILQHHRDIENEKKKLEALKEKAQVNFLVNSERSVLAKKLSKNTKHLQKFLDTLDRIADEHSLRGKLINSLKEYSGYKNNNITRQELRKILKLK